VSRFRTKVSIAALILFVAYAVYVLVASLSAGKGNGPVYWVSIVLIVALAIGALWLARWFHRRAPKQS
jgi:protein-S-isoprenylcysteine O-methyltransferase Ste14